VVPEARPTFLLAEVTSLVERATVKVAEVGEADFAVVVDAVGEMTEVDVVVEAADEAASRARILMDHRTRSPQNRSLANQNPLPPPARARGSLAF
jgi:hypothetical protein